MSMRNVGMVGKAYRTTSEAFKDADYATAITRPTNSFWTWIMSFYPCLKRWLLHGHSD